MKKTVNLFLFLLIISCGINPESIELPENKVNDIEIVFTSTEPNNDEIMITYYDIDIANNISEPYQFEYDIDGNPLPIILKFDDYKYKFLDGEAYRNNNNPSELRVRVFVNKELLLEDAAIGTSNAFATVNFSFKI